MKVPLHIARRIATPVCLVCCGACNLIVGNEPVELDPRFADAGTATPQLVAHWKFDEGTGNLLMDSSGNENHGTLEGPTWASGGLLFDGVDDAVRVPKNASLDDLRPMTAVVWMTPNSAGQQPEGLGRVLSKEGDGTQPGRWVLLVASAAGVHAKFIKSYTLVSELNQSSPNSILLQQRQQLAMTWDGEPSATGVHFYVNGQDVGHGDLQQDGQASMSSDAPFDLMIGNAEFGERCFDGIIDDIRLYRGVLSAAEIATLASE